MELEIINKLYLELSQIATATTEKELSLRAEVTRLSGKTGYCAECERLSAELADRDKQLAWVSQDDKDYIALSDEYDKVVAELEQVKAKKDEYFKCWQLESKSAQEYYNKLSDHDSAAQAHKENAQFMAERWEDEHGKVLELEDTLALTIDDAYRVFCPTHDHYRARYTGGRPLLDDRCPECELQAERTRADAYKAELDIAHISADLNERGIKWASENMVCNPDRQVDEYTLTPDEIIAKAKEGKPTNG